VDGGPNVPRTDTEHGEKVHHPVALSTLSGGVGGATGGASSYQEAVECGVIMANFESSYFDLDQENIPFQRLR